MDPRGASSRRSRWQSWRTVRLAIALAILGTPLIAWRGFLFRNNFGVVDPGRVYRSAQPKGDLEATIAAHGLRSVLNLRGGWQGDWWYADEVEDCRAHGVDFYDLPISADERPRRGDLLILLDLFDRCDYPLLIHCKSGSDRTGLASALYVLYKEGRPPEQARAAFSLHYAHIPLFGPERLHEPLKEYTAWLDARALPHTPERFRGWVERDYRPADADDGSTPPTLHPGPRAELAAQGDDVRRKRSRMTARRE